MKTEIFQVDAFTNKVFGGNPAAVVPLESWPEDSLLLSIAEENNLSETAYFVPKNDGFELRWFTPRVEIDLCGHATLASAYVLFNHLGFDGDLIKFYTRKSGELSVSRDKNLLILDFPSRPHAETEPNQKLNQALGLPPKLLQHGRDFVAIYDSEKEIRQLAPNMGELEKVAKHGVIVSAPGENVNFVVRAFFPALGIPEDPVTGTAYTVLAPYWSKKFGRNEFKAKQLSKRGGDVSVELQGDRVKISGEAALYLRGTIEV